MIIVCLAYDTDRVLLTCYLRYRRFQWPGPLRKSYNPSLLPVVKKSRIRVEESNLGPDLFNRYIHFAPLPSLRSRTQAFRFVSNSRRHFGHLSRRHFDFLPSNNPKILAGKSCIYQTLPESPRCQTPLQIIESLSSSFILTPGCAERTFRFKMHPCRQQVTLWQNS